MAGPYGGHMFNFFEKLPKTIFQSGCTILYSCQQCMRIVVVLFPLPTFDIIGLFNFSHCSSMQWYLTVVLICPSLMTNDVKHLVMCLFASCIRIFFG